MEAQKQEIRSRSVLTMSAEERQARLRDKVLRRQIKVLAVLPEQKEQGAAIKQRLSLEEIVVCESLGDMVAKTAVPHELGPVAAAVEIESPDSTIPVGEVDGIPVRTLDYVMGMEPQSRLGRIDIATAAGTSAIALVSRAS